MSLKQERVPFNKEIALKRIRSCLDREGPLLPVLHALQEEFVYINEAAEPLIAEALNITRAEVHGVITFYHDFCRAPAGRHVLKLCRAEAPARRPAAIPWRRMPKPGLECRWEPRPPAAALV